MIVTDEAVLHEARGKLLQLAYVLYSTRRDVNAYVVDNESSMT